MENVFQKVSNLLTKISKILNYVCVCMYLSIFLNQVVPATALSIEKDMGNVRSVCLKATGVM